MSIEQEFQKWVEQEKDNPQFFQALACAVLACIKLEQPLELALQYISDSLDSYLSYNEIPSTVEQAIEDIQAYIESQ